MSSEQFLDTVDLIEECRRGEEEAWAELVRRVRPTIFYICRYFRLSREELLEVFGNVLLILLERLDNIKEPDKIYAYVATAARNEAIARKRLAASSKDLKDRLEADGDKREGTNPELILADLERRTFIQAALMQLSAREYELIHMLFLEEPTPSYREISKRLGIAVPSIGPTRTRCMAKLRRILRRMGYTF